MEEEKKNKEVDIDNISDEKFQEEVSSVLFKDETNNNIEEIMEVEPEEEAKVGKNKVLNFYFKYLPIFGPIVGLISITSLGLAIASIVCKWLAVGIVMGIVFLLSLYFLIPTIVAVRMIHDFSRATRFLKKRYNEWHKTHPDMDFEYWKENVLPSFVREDREN